MAFIEVPDTALAEFIYTGPGGQAINTLYFESEIPLTSTRLSDMADELFSWWDDVVRPLVSLNYSLTAIRMTSLDSSTSPLFEFTTGLPLAGTNGHVALPSNVTGAVTFLTELRGRSYRGRNFVIGLAEDDVSGDTIDSSVVDDWVGAYEQLLITAGIMDAVWVVVSRYSGVDEDGDPIPRATGVRTPVTGVKMDNTIDSQRRRLLHRGL